MTVESFYQRAHVALLARLVDDSHWEGELSSSALSTATAMIALHTVDAAAHEAPIRRGAAWLEKTQNAEGGWVDHRPRANRMAERGDGNQALRMNGSAR